MWHISHLEQDTRLDGAVSAGQRKAARRLVAAGLAVAAPAALAGAADWSEQHEQQMRVGVVHAAGSLAAAGLYGASLVSRGPRAGRLLRLAGLAAVSASGLLGGHISFRLAGGANHAEEVPHLVKPGWQHLMAAADLPEGTVVRQLLGEVPVAAVRLNGAVHVLADRCGHMSGPLSDGELADGCLTCPWHGSVFRIADGSVARGPATAPQPAFEVREAGGAIQVCLPGAG
jgi:nitrite reductase/ring-hydroxylating ferredoxin subunit